MRRSSLAAGFGWALLALLAVQVAAVSLLRYFGDPHLAPPPILGNAFANPYLWVHVAAGSFALLIGPLQFVERLRVRWPTLHRAAGFVYVAATAISVPAALALAAGTTAGPFAGAGFAMLALLLAAFTALGLRAALQRRFHDHRAWMLRSYAMTATAITLRLMIPAAMLSGLDFTTAYPVIAWLSWMTNLALAEWLVRKSRGNGELVAGRAAPIVGSH